MIDFSGRLKTINIVGICNQELTWESYKHQNWILPVQVLRLLNLIGTTPSVTIIIFENETNKGP